jgi:uncharacterized protein (TIGR03435 family)
MMRMLQTLLADRFKVRLHRETKEVSGYALVIAKGGPKLSEHAGPATGDCAIRPSSGEFIFENCTAQDLARLFLVGPTAGAYIVDRPNKRRYDFHLSVVELPPNLVKTRWRDHPRVVNPGAPSIFTALQEQLGLKLERQQRMPSSFSTSTTRRSLSPSRPMP